MKRGREWGREVEGREGGMEGVGEVSMAHLHRGKHGREREGERKEEGGAQEMKGVSTVCGNT